MKVKHEERKMESEERETGREVDAEEKKGL